MDLGKKQRIAFPLRMALSLKEAANGLALRDGVSLNFFISVAIAEKISRLERQALAEHPLTTHNGLAAEPQKWVG
jgi:hypothetical protein